MHRCIFMKLFGSTKTLIGKTKNKGDAPSLAMVEEVLLHFNLVDDQYQ